MRIKRTVFTAAAITLALGAWMASGELVIGGRSDQAGATGEANLPPVAERRADSRPFRVRVRNVSAGEFTANLDLRGRTQAAARVDVKAETGGRIVERPVEKGQRIAAGDLMCRLETGSREARLLQARAQLAQAEFDYNAAAQLTEKGYSAQARLEALRAQRDAALAQVSEAEIELARTEIKAPVGGVVEDPLSEAGDVLSASGTCATLVTLDPMLAIGQISERDVGSVEIGMPAGVHLVTGDEATGRVSYIAASADAQTRTFRIEVTLPNADLAIRDGVTSRIRLALSPGEAHLLPPAALTLDDGGRVGARIVDEDNRAAFVPLRIVSENQDGVWVAGLPETATVIVVGQNYVVDGATVEPVFETASDVR